MKILYAEGDHKQIESSSVKYLKSELLSIISLFEEASSKKIKPSKSVNKRILKQQSKESDSSNLLSNSEEESDLDNSRTLDFFMVYYVFDKIIQKYYKVKKSSKVAKSTVKKLDDDNESVSEDEAQENDSKDNTEE